MMDTIPHSLPASPGAAAGAIAFGGAGGVERRADSGEDVHGMHAV